MIITACFVVLVKYVLSKNNFVNLCYLSKCDSVINNNRVTVITGSPIL